MENTYTDAIATFSGLILGILVILTLSAISNYMTRKDKENK